MKRAPMKRLVDMLGIPHGDTVAKQAKIFVATALHDLVAHPLIFMTGSSEFAWSVHDAIGEVATTGIAGKMLRVAGPGPLVRLAHEHLTEIGWDAPYMHLHGDGRGCGGYYGPDKRAAKRAAKNAANERTAKLASGNYVEAKDIVVGDTVSESGGWVEVKDVESGDESYPVVLTFSNGNGRRCGEAYLVRIKRETG